MSSFGARSIVVGLSCGLAAGLLSGLLGVGGGIVMVPLLVAVMGLTQHRAHATSLAAIVPIAAVGALTFAAEDAIDWRVAVLLAVGALVGAQVGARLMAGTSEGVLRMLFAALMIAVGAQMLL